MGYYRVNENNTLDLHSAIQIICKKQRICYAIQEQLCILKLHAHGNSTLFSKAYINKKDTIIGAYVKRGQ